MQLGMRVIYFREKKTPYIYIINVFCFVRGDSVTRRLSICDSTVLLKHIPDHRNEDIITVVET